MEKYTFEGTTYNVAPNRLEEFMVKFPNATKVDEPGKTTDPASNVMDSGSDDGLLELPEDKGFIEDMVQVFKQSRATGGTVDEAFDIYKLGKDISDEQLQAVIDAKAEMDKYGPTNEQASFAKAQKENGGGVVGTLLALKDNIGFLPQLLVGSATTMLTSLQSDEVAGTTAAAAGVGAGVGAAAGASGFALGPLGVATTAAGAKLGASSGAIGGLVGAMETGLTLMDLIQEEVGEGVKLTKENIRSVIDDNDKFEKIKQRAAARGRNIGAVEAMTFGISRGVGSSLNKAGKFRRSIAAETSIETTGGFTGEIAGQIGAEQDIDLGEATLEAIGEVAGPGQIINLSEIVKATLQKSKYNINGEKRSKKEILDLIESDKLTNEEKTKIKFNVENDEKFAKFIGGKLNDISLETQIDAKVEDPADRTKLVDLEKQRAKAEADTKKSGIFKVINADTKLENVEMQINEIVGKYTAIDGRTKDVRARKKTAEQVRENIADKNFETNLEFAKKHSKLYGLEVEDNLTQDQIKEKYGDELAGSLGGIVDNKLVINKKLAKTRVYGDNVANHELLHGIIKASGQKIKQSTINNFLNLIGEKNAAVIQKRIDDNYDAKYMADTPDEYFTIFSDAIANGEIQFNDNIFTKVKDVIRRTFADLGYAKVDFESAQGAYNFLKDYNKSIHKGALASGVVKATKGEGRVETPKFSKEASNKVQSIYEEQGEAGAFEIIEQFKPIVSRIAEKRREAPNFDKELLMSEIEIGERGILDLISKYDPNSGVPLAAYINKFLPSRAIEASRRVLGEEFTEDVSERVDIAAEEVADVDVKAKPKKKKIILSDRLGVKSKVDKAIKAKLPELDIENLNFKTLKDQAPEITGEMFGISPKKLISGANITKKELQSAQMFINKNAEVLISMLPEGATASGTATGVPQTLLKAFYTKTDRAKMAKTGTKAGLAVQVKNNIKKVDFLETFGIIDGKPDRTDRNTSARVLALANQTGKMMTNQAVREQLFENITEENAKSMLKLSDGKSAVMFSKSKAKENNMPNIAKYFVGKTEADVASILDQHASLTEEQFKEAFPNEHGNVKNYIEDMAQFVADGGKEAMQFTKEMKGTNFGNSELTNYLKTGYWNLSDAKFKQDKKAMKWFVSNAHDLANQILLPKNATNGNMRIIMGFFAGHYNIVGSDMAKVGSVLKQGIVDRLNEKGKSVLSKETLSRWKNFDFENLKSSYASTFYTGLKKIYAANTLKEQKAIAKEYFTGKEGATQKDFYDLWNTTLEEWLHSSEVGSKEFNSKADYILKLKKANAAIGTTGERVMAPGGYVYLPGSIMDGKIKFEHLKSSSQQSKESALLVINNKFKEFGDLATEDYTGIYGPLELFNAVDDATGKVNSSNIFRLAGNLEAAKSIYSIDNLNQSLYDDIVSTIGKDKIKFLEQAGNKSQVQKLDKAIMFSRSANNETKGITVLDFDDTLATSKSLVISTSPEGVVRKLTAEEFATEGADLLDQGWTHDFSEFSKVVDGKVASLFKKAMKLQGKFGPENMFVLTARPADSAPAIFEFLKANGLNIPLKNITGLANSTSESKALWIADKVGEGFNDFYFADDALQNVQAVKNMLDQFDVKSKVQQAKVKFSKSMNDQFNDILENVTGIESDKRFSIIKGRKRGESKGKFRVFIPPSHEDFVGLLYNFLGKGKEGNAHRDFFEQALIRPLNRANREFDTARQSVANDYKELNKQFEDVRKKLTKKTPDGDFTFQDAIRVYLWDKHGHKIPGLSETDQAKLAELVTSDPQLQAYAETLNVISKQETYVNPTDGWNSGDIRMDLDDATGRIGRKQFFAEFIENADVIFSEENLNKIEAGYGKGVRESLEDMLYRIETGRNRPTGQNEQVNKLMNYLNGSVGTVMFFNMRSALLQQMSIVNYINFADNNIFAAAKAFANQKQYWADWSFIFNSDMLKQRRGGIQTDVNGAELAASLRNSKDITRKLISKLLELGFLPTQIGDNIAIATGGATYYRNRINKYIKQGMSQKEAEAAAFTDFQDITQSTQQSARPDMVSKQQASVIGKVILNFQNVTSQFNRLGKKAFQDIYNRRITKPNTTQMQSDISNASRITYYFAVQNAIFYTLQTALFAMMFDDDEEDVNNLFIKKQERLINGSIDSVLRGSGLIGGVVATLKNVAIAFARQRDVKYNPDESAVGLEALNLSPVLGIKLRKIVNAEKTLNYNKKVIKEMETFDIDNPQWSAVTNYTEAFTNIPLNRLYNKTQNVRQALNNEHAAWERTLMFLGWSQYNLDLENKKMEEIKEKTKSKKKRSKKRSGPRIINL